MHNITVFRQEFTPDFFLRQGEFFIPLLFSFLWLSNNAHLLLVLLSLMYLKPEIFKISVHGNIGAKFFLFPYWQSLLIKIHLQNVTITSQQNMKCYDYFIPLVYLNYGVHVFFTPVEKISAQWVFKKEYIVEKCCVYYHYQAKLVLEKYI